MVRLIPVPYVRHVPNDALRARVVLPRARRPLARVLDVHFPGRVHEAEEHPGHGGYGIFPVVDVRQAEVRVDVIRERLVPDLCAHNRK